MAGKTPTLYDVKKTTIWFFVASFVLFLGLAAMLVQDSSRDWKKFQRQFMTLSREKAKAELERTKQSVDQSKLSATKEDLKTAQAALKSRKGDLKKIDKESEAVSLQRTKVNTEFQTLQQYQDSDRYFYEEFVLHHETQKAETYGKQIEKRKPELAKAKVDLENLDAKLEELKTQRKTVTEEVDKNQKEIARLNFDIDLLETKIKKLTPNLATELLNAPMLDFMNPTLRIQQIVVENIKDDYYFAKVEKVDRCVTCHLGIDQKGFEDAPQPFRTHPRLDLYLSAESGHPMETFGCTTCHGGSGHSVNFTTAAHTPNSEEQEKEWKKKHHWQEMEYWDDKMLPMRYIEASCAKCHTGTREVPEAKKLNEGRLTAEKFGCFACHKVEGFAASNLGAEGSWKVGPSLLNVQSKLQEDWIIRWLHNPKEFRPSTKMPRIFHLSNTSDPLTIDKEDAVIAGVAAYLMKNSEAVTLEKAPTKGKPEEGKRLIQQIGCLGCHTVGDQKANDHGPELTNLGSKVEADWLFTWLKNPKHFAAGTRMPNLRLTDEEAMHITSYLLSEKNEPFESMRLPEVKPEAVDEMALSYLVGNMRTEDAKAKLTQMSVNERLEYLGEKTIARQGCFGCHDIKGFADAKQIGTELTHEGSKEIEKLDFGFIPISRTRYDWFNQKLKEPRIFDQGKVRNFLDKLRMPQFDFTEEQIEALTTFLLSLQKAEIPLEMRKVLSSEEKEIERGRQLVAKLNCTGCHTLDGKQGGVRSMMEDLGLAPPVLDGEGAKVQENWLYHFLEKPSTIRPWLQYRMPTFDLKDEELKTLVVYFNHLSDVGMSITANEIPATTTEMITNGRELFKALQCIKCHQATAPEGLSASFLAPNLVMAHQRLRPGWIVEWLNDPQKLQEGTMMPTFFSEGTTPLPDILEGSAEKQIHAMRDYLMVFTTEEANSLNQTGTGK